MNNNQESLLITLLFFASTIAFCSDFALGEINKDRFEAELTRQLAGPSTEGGVLDTREVGYVMVTGLGNLTKPIYFRSVIAGIKESAGEEAITSYLQGEPDRSDIHSSADLLANRMMELSLTYPKMRWRVLAHSMGAIDFYTLMHKNPNIAAILDAVIFLNGPWEGSELVPELYRDTVENLYEFRAEPVAYTAATYLKRMYRKFGKPRDMLDPKRMKEFLAQVEAEGPPGLLSKMSNHLLWIGSVEQTENMGLALAHPINSLMGICSGIMGKISNGTQTDGMLSLKSQLPGKLPQREITVTGYHHAAFSHGNPGHALGRAMTVPNR